MNDQQAFYEVRAFLDKAVADEPPYPGADLPAILDSGRRRARTRRIATVGMSVAGTLAATVLAIIITTKPAAIPPVSVLPTPLQTPQVSTSTSPSPSPCIPILEPPTPDLDEAQRLQEVLRHQPILTGGLPNSDAQKVLHVEFAGSPGAEYTAQAYLKTALGNGTFHLFANEPDTLSCKPVCNTDNGCTVEIMPVGTRLQKTVRDGILQVTAIKRNGAYVTASVDNHQRSPDPHTATPPLTESQLVQLVLTPDLTPTK